MKNTYTCHSMNNFIHKSVTTRDGADLGIIIAVDQMYVNVGEKIKSLNF